MTAAAHAVSQLQQKLPSLKAPKKFLSDAQYFNATTKNETLIRQLNSNSVSGKLEAMKKVIAQLSKGRDVSDLFPAVVKNVASTSLEVKKLVYLYVIHYAEEKHDEALLSIAHFQKDMADKSQHVRALSLRVLSSIRVPIIVQIVLLAIRKCTNDPSPWVRKAAALAVPKIYNLNQEEKPQLVQIIDQLLGDNSPTVHGAAAHAFCAVCPENYSLLHKHYRKLVRQLPQVDEWGQVVLLNLLLRYARTQFLSPFKEGYKRKKKFYDSESASSSASSDEEDYVEYEMDEDHRLLLNNALPLLQSNNHAVIVAVASLYLHLAPQVEFSPKIGKALLRILRSTRERQYVALMVIHTLATQRPAAFRPFIKQFYVTPADPIFTQQMKIDTLALLADSTNVSEIINEFKMYLHSGPEELLASTVRALGRVAFNNQDVSETCLSTLAELTTHPNEIVVGESVVVTRHLLQKVSTGQGKIILRLTRLLDSLELPLARASIVWLVGEYLKVPQVAQVGPDTFRSLLKSFVTEDVNVKQQVMILGAKLMVHEYEEERVRERIEELFQYMLKLVQYDESYTLRDRARIIRRILMDKDSDLREKAQLVFVVAKKEADFTDPGEERARFQAGSLSHVLNMQVSGYIPLSDFPQKQPDVSVRDDHMEYSSESDDSDDSEESEESDSFYSDSDESSAKKSKKKTAAKRRATKDSSDETETESEETESETESESESESETESEESSESSEPPKPVKKAAKEPKKEPKKEEKKPTDLLQFMGDFAPAEKKPETSPAAKHSDPLASAWGFGQAEIDKSPAKEKPHTASGGASPRADARIWHGLVEGDGVRAEYSFTDEPGEYDDMTVVEVRLTNTKDEGVEGVCYNELEEPETDVTVIPFSTVTSLAPSEVKVVTMHVNWAVDSDDDDAPETPPPVIFNLGVGDSNHRAVIERK